MLHHLAFLMLVCGARVNAGHMSHVDFVIPNYLRCVD